MKKEMIVLKDANGNYQPFMVDELRRQISGTKAVFGMPMRYIDLVSKALFTEEVCQKHSLEFIGGNGEYADVRLEEMMIAPTVLAPEWCKSAIVVGDRVELAPEGFSFEAGFRKVGFGPSEEPVINIVAPDGSSEHHRYGEHQIVEVKHTGEAAK